MMIAGLGFMTLFAFCMLPRCQKQKSLPQTAGKKCRKTHLVLSDVYPDSQTDPSPSSPHHAVSVHLDPATDFDHHSHSASYSSLLICYVPFAYLGLDHDLVFSPWILIGILISASDPREYACGLCHLSYPYWVQVYSCFRVKVLVTCLWFL